METLVMLWIAVILNSFSGIFLGIAFMKVKNRLTRCEKRASKDGETIHLLLDYLDVFISPPNEEGECHLVDNID